MKTILTYALLLFFAGCKDFSADVKPKITAKVDVIKDDQEIIPEQEDELIDPLPLWRLP